MPADDTIITIPIKWITDKNKQNFFPVTHLNAVRNTQNENLTVLLGRKQDTITSDNKLDWDLVDHPALQAVNNATLTIQRNGVNVQTFTANAASNKTANILVPTSASDVNALPSSTKYGASLSLTMNSTTYVVTAQLKDQDGNNLGTAQTIDLPLESVVVSGSYDASTKKVILTLQSGSTVEFSVADLISGLQTEITSSNKLSADLVQDGTTNKVYTATEQTKLSGIAAGAEVNVQSDWSVSDNTSDAYIKNKPTIGNATLTIQKNGTTVNTFKANATSNVTANITVPTKTSDLTNDGDGANAFLTQHQDISGKQDKITSTNQLSADLIQDGTTNKAYTATEKTKLNGIAAGAEVNVQSDWSVVDNSSDAFIKNKPTIGDGTLTIWQNQTSKGTFTANQATNADITITVPTKTSDLANDGDGTNAFLTQHQDISGKQDTLVSGTNIKTINNESLLGSGNITIQGGSSTLSALTDTTISSPTANQILTYDDTTSKWVNSDIPTEVLVCTLTVTGTSDPDTGEWTMSYSCDKTDAEIYAAYVANKSVLLKVVGEDYSWDTNAPEPYTVYRLECAQSSTGGNNEPWYFFSFQNSTKFLSEVFKIISPTTLPPGVYLQHLDRLSGDLPNTISSSATPGWYFSTDAITRPQNTTSGHLASLTSSGKYSDSGIASTDVSTAITNSHTHSNKTILDYIPSTLGTAGQVLRVNSGATGLEFGTVSGGLTNYDFTHTANTTISGSTTTVTFAANTRGSAMLTISADLGLTIACNNGSDNYIWVKNTGSSDVDITISGVTKNSTNVSNVYVPSGGISVPAGGLCEIGVIVNTDGAFITSRNDLAL